MKEGQCLQASMSTRVGMHSRSRSVSQRLVAYHSHLVEHGRERWHVRTEAPGYHGEQLPDAQSAIEGCLRERRAEDAAVRADGRPYQPPVRAGEWS